MTMPKPMVWLMLHPQATPDMLGYIPAFLSESDPRPARDQINSAYIGGWIPFPGFTMRAKDHALLYPGDPPTRLLAETKLRDETIRFYEFSWLAIVQPDGSWEVSRLD